MGGVARGGRQEARRLAPRRDAQPPAARHAGLAAPAGAEPQGPGHQVRPTASLSVTTMACMLGRQSLRNALPSPPAAVELPGCRETFQRSCACGRQAKLQPETPGAQAAEPGAHRTRRGRAARAGHGGANGGSGAAARVRCHPGSIGSGIDMVWGRQQHPRLS